MDVLRRPLAFGNDVRATRVVRLGDSSALCTQWALAIPVRDEVVLALGTGRKPRPVAAATATNAAMTARRCDSTIFSPCIVHEPFGRVGNWAENMFARLPLNWNSKSINIDVTIVNCCRVSAEL
jgi:hypothetical protein